MDKYSPEAFGFRQEGADIWQNVLRNLGDARESEQSSLKLHYEAHWKLKDAYDALAKEYETLRVQYTYMLEEHIKCLDHLET